MIKSIYGGKPKNPIAYCHLHKGVLTVRELKTKECLKKQCRHLQKFSHQYWDEREARKQRDVHKENAS